MFTKKLDFVPVADLKMYRFSGWDNMKGVLRIFDFFIWPLLVVFFIVNVYCCYNAVFDIFPYYDSYYGFVIGLILYFGFRHLQRKNIDFLETFSHELMHFVVGLLFLLRVKEIGVEPSKGFVKFVHTNADEHSKGNPFLALAPYCLPIFTYVLLLIRMLIARGNLWLFDILVGFSVGFHVLAIRRDLKVDQPDIKEQGVLFSYLFVWSFILFSVSIILWTMPLGTGAAIVKWWNCAVFLAGRVA